MYSALPRLPEAWIVRPGRTDQPVNVSALFAGQRVEIDYLAALRTELCGVTDAAAIRLVVRNQPAEVAEC